MAMRYEAGINRNFWNNRQSAIFYVQTCIKNNLLPSAFNHERISSDFVACSEACDFHFKPSSCVRQEGLCLFPRPASSGRQNEPSEARQQSLRLLQILRALSIVLR